MEVQEKSEVLGQVLNFIDKNVDPNVQKELLALLEAISSATEDTDAPVLSDSTLNFLESNFWQHPSLVHWLIDQLLCVWSVRFKSTDSSLQNIYIKLVKTILKPCLSSPSRAKNENLVTPKKHLQVLLFILSRLNLTEDIETHFLEWLNPALLNSCKFADVELALYARKDPTYYKTWHKFLDDNLGRNKSPENLENSLEIMCAIFDNPDCKIRPTELLIRTIKTKRHWLLDIVDMCCIFVEKSSNRLDLVVKISRHFPNFWLLILLKILTDTTEISPEPLQFILTKANLRDLNIDVMNRLDKTLNDNLRVLEWIKQNDPSGKISLRKVLTDLQTCSILSVLKNCFQNQFHDIDEDICYLLNDCEESRMTYRAYRAVLSAIKGIFLCQSYTRDFGGVLERFEEMERYLNGLEPMGLRLETMENVFAIMFMRHEDFVNDNSSDCGDDYEEIVRTEYRKSTREASATGFVCNKYAIREVIHYLNKCLTAVTHDFDILRPEVGRVPGFEERILNLGKYLTEATWRLELLTSSEFVRRQGSSDAEVQEQECAVVIEDVISQPEARENFYNPNESSSSGETENRGSDVDLSSESGSTGYTGLNSQSRRRRKFRSNLGTRDATSGRKVARTSLNYMLATTETLVVRCLWKNDYAEAQRVIETLGMENSSLAGEIAFFRAIKTFREDLKKQSLEKLSAVSPNPTSGHSKNSTIDKIRQAVKEGLESSRKSSQLETFLASQEANLSLLCTSTTKLKDLMTLTALDLTLTSSRDYLTSENLAEVTKHYLESTDTIRNTQFHDFFRTVYQILHESKTASITKIINNANYPLSLRDYKKKVQYWSELEASLQLLEGKTMLLDRLDCSAELKNHVSNLLTICNNGDPYLRNMQAYLQTLANLAPELGESSPVNPSLLSNSLDSYIGYQIFDLNVDLEVLEKIANDLQINLVYSILMNCCPKLPYFEADLNLSSDRWGTLILNKSGPTHQTVSESSSDPNECVITILSDLLASIRAITPDQVLTQSTLINLSKDETIQKVLLETAALSSVDLSHLSFGNHTLSFFLNLWNLLFLHSAISIWSHQPPANDLRHIVSLRTIGYELGDLGILTLFTLRSKLIGDLPCDYGTCFESHVEELNEPAWQDLDLQQDPRTMFGMVNEYQVSPTLKVYHPDTINDDLNDAIQDYVDFYTKSNHQVILPEIFTKSSSIDDACRLEGEASKYLYQIQLEYRRSQGECHGQRSFSIGGTWQTREISPSLLQYLENHCWLLYYLVQRVHDKTPPENSSLDFGRTSVLENLLSSRSTECLQYFFNDNQVLAGLYANHLPIFYIWNCLEELLLKKDWTKSLDLLNNLPDATLSTNPELQKLKDKILSQVIDNIGETSDRHSEIFQHLYQIQDIQTLTQVVLSKVELWPVKICEEAVSHILHHSHNDQIPAHCKSKLNEIICRVMVFDKMLPYFKDAVSNLELNWYNIVYRTEKTDPTKIVKSLIDAKQYELCLEWLEYQTSSSDIYCLVSQDLLLGLLTNPSSEFKHARKLLSALPLGQSEKLCKGVIEKIQSLDALRFIISYLAKYSLDKDKWRRGSLGVDVLGILDTQDRCHYVHLVIEPLLLLEQLLMNLKFDNLKQILKSFTNQLKCLEITVERLDKIIRFYARKSLDLRVAVQRDQFDASLSMKLLRDQNLDFIMPRHPPSRDQWIPNDKASACSCCKITIFSMFNRRHHCRRCGRVVCGSCSNQRMMVTGYANSVPVRICNDCKNQTAQLYAASSTASSENFECWKLSVNEAHNNTIREEFGFEYAPNISLCLAILDLHSDHEAYANFLQDRCDEMKQLLYPDGNGQINREIDHGLIIKMIRSLLIAAKVKYAKLGLNTGLAHCDRFLSQVDLIDILVKSDCLALLPRDDLNEHTFRRLRDLLTEKEQWILALDVSTKSGLDTQGVWAAWGKACLKVGYYERAREKFAHCLDRVNEEVDDWVMLPYPSRSRPTEGKSTKNRPSKDPPLVLEILQILESCHSTEPYTKSQSAHSTNNTAQEILKILGNVKGISHGQYPVPKVIPSIQSIRYQESLYYLLMYGSYNSILEFFLRHNELDKCLDYTLDNDVDPEIFFNVAVIGSVKVDKLTKLCDTMRAKDATLMTWKKYLIATCLYLERKQLMNTLYQLQLFMKDYVRAAMTCIKFYVTDATTYTDLCTRTHHLTDGQKHLESELQLAAFGSERKRRKSVSSNISGSGSLTMEMEPGEIDKHMNTISRQMEIAKFLGNCEKEGRKVNDYLSKLSYMECEGLQPRSVPTLFGNQKERTHLAVLAILCGRDVEEGFGFAFRIMQDYCLSPQKVYSLVGHILALDKRVGSIEQLIKCCRSSGAPNSQAISDRVLAHCVKLLLDKSKAEASPSPKDQIDCLIRIINDVEMKIDCYIESKQLKAAYLLAVKHSRAQDIRKILREADRLGQVPIKSICTKWLQQAKK